MNDARLVAVCDLDSQKTKNYADEFSVKSYSDFNKMLTENKNIDVEKANNIEKKALETFDATRDLMKIIELRDKVTKLYDRIKNEFEEIQAF